MSDSTAKYLNLLSFYRLMLTGVVCVLLFLNALVSKLEILPNYNDEFILFGIFCYAMIRSFKDVVVRRALFIYIALFILLTVLSINAIASRGVVIVLSQVFIHLKFILFFIFCWAILGPKWCLTLVYILFGVTIMFLFINLATGSLFNVLFDTEVSLRSGIARPIGIQADTAGLGTTFAIFSCLFISGLKIKDNQKKVGLILGLTVLILLATTRTALIVLPLILLWWFKDSVKTFLIASVLLIISITYVSTSKHMEELIDITIENIQWTIEDPVASSYIRGIMIYFAVELAVDRFPLGTGAGTYGTVTSDDSPVYAEIGLQNSVYFVEKKGIYDSNLASLLGEFGVFGMLIYLAAFWRVATLASKLKPDKYELDNEFKFVFGLSILAYSITTPVFMNTYPAFILALTLVAATHTKAE